MCFGGGVISHSHFHVMILYFSDSAHTQTHIHMRIHQSSLRVSILLLSCFVFHIFFSSGPNVTKITVQS